MQPAVPSFSQLSSMHVPIPKHYDSRPTELTEASAGTAGHRDGKRLRETAPTSTSRSPQITVVTVVYNGAEKLRSTIESVLQQEREDLEYIVVDGGSVDRTVDLLRGYGDKLAYWISEPDSGIYNAMNKAVHLAAHDSYVLFLGAGDKILHLPDAATIAAAKAAGTQILYGDVLIGDWLFQSSFGAKLTYRNTLHHQGLFVRKGCPDEPWFDESLKVFSDWDLNLVLFKRGVRAQPLGDTVAYAEPDGVSAKLHLPEIAWMIAKRCGWMRALAAVGYHGGLHILRRYASISTGSRE